jgi:hypothetical protein
MLGLADPAPVACLHDALAAPVLVPAPRPALPRFRGAAGGGPLPGLGVFQVQVVVGADGPARQQPRLPVGPGDGVGVNDAQVHPGHPPRNRPLVGR